MGDSYESFYNGGYSSLSPTYGNFVGYRMAAGQIGFPGSAQTANQLGEAVNAIKQGVKVFEVTMVDANAADQIPKEHFREIAALSKLTGVKPSVHAPIIDPAGFGERGWDGEQARLTAERRLIATIDKAHILDKEGNVPVVIHSTAGLQGSEFVPEKGVEPGQEGRFHEKRLILIDQDSRQITAVQEDRKYHPTGGSEDLISGIGEKNREKGGTLRIPREEIYTMNNSDWSNKLTNLAFYKKESDDLIRAANPPMLAKYWDEPVTEQNVVNLSQESKEAFQSYQKLKDTDIFLENVKMNFGSAFHRAFKYGTEEQQKELVKLSEAFTHDLGEAGVLPVEVDGRPRYKKTFATPVKYKEALDKAINGLNYITDPRNRLGGAPEVFKPVEEFALDKTAETFGNVAFKAFDNYGQNSPVLAIENMFQGMAFSRAEDMEKIIKTSRENFAKKLMKEKGMSQGEANNTAEKFIGATWDVGHLNMMKKQGFTDKDVIAETKKIQPYVKHVHLTDNFGFSDSHLAPGMGNVPFKDILRELEKNGVLDKARKIVEAPGFFQHFKRSPHPYVLSAFGSGVYSMKAGPSWNQVMDTQGGYFGFPMAYVPEKHFSMYGTGFSLLPEELGGQMPGTQSRFSGTPNA